MWLNEWQIPLLDGLILIGPSAGYTLPTRWLKTFPEIQAFDFDPLCSVLFRRQHGRLPITFHRENVFWLDGKLSVKPLQQILKTYSLMPVLFCNVLGQVLLEGQATPEEWESFLAQLRCVLSMRQWASYHDLYSIEPLPLKAHAVVLEGELEITLKDVATEPLTLVDHALKGGWSTGLSKKLFYWSLTPSSVHLIEGVRAEGKLA